MYVRPIYPSESAVTDEVVELAGGRKQKEQMQVTMGDLASCAIIIHLLSVYRLHQSRN